MDVETLGVGFALGPRNDVGGTEERGVADAGERTAALPVVHEAGAEDVLTDALDDESLGLGGFGEISRLLVKGF